MKHESKHMGSLLLVAKKCRPCLPMYSRCLPDVMLCHIIDCLSPEAVTKKTGEAWGQGFRKSTHVGKAYVVDDLDTSRAKAIRSWFAWLKIVI